MKIEIEVPEYTRDVGIQLLWEDGFDVALQYHDGAVHLQANQAGLISLARHLLSLAQADVPVCVHLHLDELNALEAGSCELIIEKVAA